MVQRKTIFITYEKGKINTEFNGWRFLKEEPVLWEELKNCNFYDTKNSQMIFYCPRDFQSEKISALFYYLEKKKFRMEKIKEEDFLRVLENDIKNIYSFLKNCSISNFSSFQVDNYPPFLEIFFDCFGEKYLISTDFTLVPLAPPILVNSEIPLKERAKISFEKSFPCKIDKIEEGASTVQITSLCEDKNFVVEYVFESHPHLRYLIKDLGTDYEAILQKFAKYFILPPLKEIKEIKLISKFKPKTEMEIIVFKTNSNELIGLKNSNILGEFGFGRNIERVPLD